MNEEISAFNEVAEYNEYVSAYNEVSARLTKYQQT